MECKHEWIEDEMFADGVVMMISGTIGDLGHETRVQCKNCDAVDYVPKDVFNRINILEEMKRDAPSKTKK